MDHFSKKQARERRDFRGFQDHGTAGCDGWDGLQHDLVHWPVPRGDQSSDANRLHHCAFIWGLCAKGAIKFEIAKGVDKALQMPCACADLLIAGQLLWRAHLKADGLRHFGLACFVDLKQFFQQHEPLFFGCLRPGGKGRFGRCNRCIGIVLTTK